MILYLLVLLGASSALKEAPIRQIGLNKPKLTKALEMVLPQTALDRRVDPSNQRYNSFVEIMRLIMERNARVLVETGTSRDGDTNCGGDGCSTLIFGYLAQTLGLKIYSVDINPVNCERARKATKVFGDSVEVVLSDSLAYLENFQGMIDFLYLDSYDFDYNNPNPSQDHHRKEITIAYKNLHRRSIVMVDDCLLPHGGKCPMVTEFLLKRGWKIHFSGYQIIMLQED